MIHRITKGTLGATDAWTAGRHDEDCKFVELDYVLAVALANAKVLKVTQAEPSHGFVAWRAPVDCYAPMSSNDPARALQPILATPKKGRRNHHQRNDGRRRTSTNGPRKRWYARCVSDAE